VALRDCTHLIFMSRACCIGLESGIRRRQRLRRHALDLAPTIRPDDLANESKLHASAAVGIRVCGERRRARKMPYTPQD